MYSVTRKDESVALKLILDGPNDHFLIGGVPTHLTGTDKLITLLDYTIVLLF